MRKESIPLTDLRLLIRNVDDEAVEPVNLLLGQQQPPEGAVIDGSHALIGTSLSTICACLQVHDCVEQTLLFVLVAVKWTVCTVQVYDSPDKRIPVAIRRW